MKRVLFDSDVLLDVLAKRQQFIVASAQALNTVTKPQLPVQGYTSCHFTSSNWQYSSARTSIEIIAAYSSCQRNQ